MSREMITPPRCCAVRHGHDPGDDHTTHLWLDVWSRCRRLWALFGVTKILSTSDSDSRATGCSPMPQRLSRKVRRALRQLQSLPALPFFRNSFRNVNCCLKDSKFNHEKTKPILSATSNLLSPYAVSNTLQSITAGLSLQPSDNAPSGWLALSTLVGLPLALWAYKVRRVIQLGVIKIVC